MTIDKIIEIDDEVFEVSKRDAGKVFLSFKTNGMEKTGKALSLFQAKIGFLKNGIYDQVAPKNIYAARILFRSLIEHYLKAKYILFESAESGDDTIASDYYEFADASELLQLGSAYKIAGEILYPGRSYGNVYDVLKNQFPKLLKFTPKEISTKLSKYNYKYVIEYLYDILYVQRKSKGDENNFLINLIPLYSDLSSYVHGGPSADKDIMDLSQKGELAIDVALTNVFYDTIMISTHFSSLLYMFSIKFDKIYRDLFIDTHTLLQKLIKLKKNS